MYPDAKLVGMEGLDERKKADGLTFDYLFNKENRQMQFGPAGEVLLNNDDADNRLTHVTSLELQTRRSRFFINLQRR